MFEQLAVEIDHVAVGVAFAEDGDEAKDVRLISECGGVGGDHAFGGGFDAP